MSCTTVLCVSFFCLFINCSVIASLCEESFYLTSTSRPFFTDLADLPDSKFMNLQHCLRSNNLQSRILSYSAELKLGSAWRIYK